MNCGGEKVEGGKVLIQKCHTDWYDVADHFHCIFLRFGAVKCIQ